MMGEIFSCCRLIERGMNFELKDSETKKIGKPPNILCDQFIEKGGKEGKFSKKLFYVVNRRSLIH